MNRFQTSYFIHAKITMQIYLIKLLPSFRQAMEEAPLQTRSARELERDTTTLRMLRDYPTTLVRIRFPDRHILQASFRTADSMASLHQWLASFLRKPDTPFYLCKKLTGSLFWSLIHNLLFEPHSYHKM